MSSTLYYSASILICSKVVYMQIYADTFVSSVRHIKFYVSKYV